MELYTMDRNFFKQETIDSFKSAIWVERYHGDGDFELSVPATPGMLTLLPKGQLMMCEDSDIPMILENREIDEGVLKTTGISLTPWLNSRFIRTSADYKVTEWQFSKKPADALRHIVQSMCVGSDYLSGVIPIGILPAILELLPIPGLQAVNTDTSGTVVNFSVPFGPVYDALKEIASTYDVGMEISLDGAFEEYYILTFRSYKGADRTSAQDVNPVVRFSSDMNSFTNIKDLESIADYKNLLFVFPPTDIPPAYASGPGVGAFPDADVGFDLRAFHGISESFDTTGLSDSQIYDILTQKMITEAKNHKAVALVDGEIVQVEGAVYGTNFFLGDIVEVVGNTGVLQNARITEYIRSQDEAGERAYPALTMMD